MFFSFAGAFPALKFLSAGGIKTPQPQYLLQDTPHEFFCQEIRGEIRPNL
jgi:hypothetical protein